MSIKVKINNDWVDTNIKAVRGVNHVNSEDVYIWCESNSKSKKIIYIKSLNIDTLIIDKINNNNLKIKNYGL